MKNSVNFVRRRLLTTFGYLGALSIPGIRHAVADLNTSDLIAIRLTGLFKDRKSAASVGKKYLQMVPEEANIDVLVNLICSHQDQEYLELVNMNTARLRQFLKNQRSKDFGAGRVVNVQGWILSETEIRLCALTTLI